MTPLPTGPMLADAGRRAAEPRPLGAEPGFHTLVEGARPADGLDRPASRQEDADKPKAERADREKKQEAEDRRSRGSADARAEAARAEAMAEVLALRPLTLRSMTRFLLHADAAQMQSAGLEQSHRGAGQGGVDGSRVGDVGSRGRASGESGTNQQHQPESAQPRGDAPRPDAQPGPARSAGQPAAPSQQHAQNAETPAARRQAEQGRGGSAGVAAGNTASIKDASAGRQAAPVQPSELDRLIEQAVRQVNGRQAGAPAGQHAGQGAGDASASAARGVMASAGKSAEPEKAGAGQPMQGSARVMAVKPVREQVFEGVRLAMNERTGTATVRLDPPELGRLRVKVQATADRARLELRVESADARREVERIGEQLRERLAGQGIRVEQVRIEVEPARPEQAGRDGRDERGGAGRHEPPASSHDDGSAAQDGDDPPDTGGSHRAWRDEQLARGLWIGLDTLA